MVEAVLPADDGTDHEQPGTAEDDRGEKDDDLSVRGRWRVGGEGELRVWVCECVHK